MVKEMDTSGNNPRHSVVEKCPVWSMLRNSEKNILLAFQRSDDTFQLLYSQLRFTNVFHVWTANTQHVLKAQQHIFNQGVSSLTVHSVNTHITLYTPLHHSHC